MKEIKQLSEKKWQHSISVAKLAGELAIKWGVDPVKAYLAGILHDIAREIPQIELIRMSQEAGIPIGAEEKNNPILLHAPVGAYLAATKYRVSDGEILSAINKHTVGDKEMSILDKIIYMADILEPLRNFPGSEQLRRLAFQDLDRALMLTIVNEVAYLNGKALKVHSNTLLMKETLQKKENNIGN